MLFEKTVSREDLIGTKSLDETLETVSLAALSSLVNIKCTTQASLTQPTKLSTIGSLPAAINYRIKSNTNLKIITKPKSLLKTGENTNQFILQFHEILS